MSADYENTTFSKITLVDWGTNPAVMENTDHMMNIMQFIDDCVFNDLTNGIGITLSTTPFVRKRYWSSQESAQAYLDHLTTVVGPQYDIYPVSTQIIDNPNYISP